mmetsp:Transcript_40014/g.127978  ORF Transcript_40014/g.127978 Transcript_40014/m.127978 type:complete len:306 (-) Transcript_40014:238-1155(-)
MGPKRGPPGARPSGAGSPRRASRATWRPAPCRSCEASARPTPLRPSTLRRFRRNPTAEAPAQGRSAVLSAGQRTAFTAQNPALRARLSGAPRLRIPARARALGSGSAAMATAAQTIVPGTPKTVLVPIANGSEEMEAVIIIDVLVRAGAKVTVASLEDTPLVTCSRGVQLVADCLIGDCAGKEFNLVALPGGMPGAERIRDCAVLEDIVKLQSSSGRLVGAICATPAVALQPWGLLEDKAATAHPAFSSAIGGSSARVVVDGNLVTSRGPGTAFEFALELVRLLVGEETRDEVAGPMVMWEGWNS